MTSENINDAVLDAFRVEYREQIDEIRTLLAAFEPGEVVANDVHIQDAFRLAHSFKGGARVCDLRDIERLGHALEAVLEQLNQGSLDFTDNVIATVNHVLDAIEDWMNAFDQQQKLPDINDTLASIEHLVPDSHAGEARTIDRPKSPSTLHDVFRQEYLQNVERIQHLLSQWDGQDASPTDVEIAEAGRLAHSLAGAARVVQVSTVEELARSLEQLFHQIRSSQHFDIAVQKQIDEWLALMEQAMRTLPAHDDTDSRPAAAGQQLDDSTKLPPTAGHKPLITVQPAATAAHETVRLSVDTLDRLMRSSAEMLTDNQRVTRFTRELRAFQIELANLERERETIRRSASASLHKLAATPEFERVGRYLDFVDRQVSLLTRHARQLFAEQRRTAWLIHARSQQVQRDVCEARMLPARSIFQGFRKMVRDLAKSQGKEIEFHVDGLDVRIDRMVLQILKDPIMHVLRNSVSHGIEGPQQRQQAGKPPVGTISLNLKIASGWLHVTVDDDGQGIQVPQVIRQAIQRGLITEAEAAQRTSDDLLSLVFTPGLSTSESITELAGRGMGLSIVHDAVARLQGHAKLDLRPEGGTRITLSVPVSVSTHRVLLVRCGQQTFAIPMSAIERLLRIQKTDIDSVEGQPVVVYEQRPIRLVQLSNVLGFAAAASADGDKEVVPTLLLKTGAKLVAVAVDAFIEERDAILTNLDEFAANAKLAGAILLEDGQIVLVVQTGELFECVKHSVDTVPPPPIAPKQKSTSSRILIVDDSFTTRTLQKSILEANGYEVSMAVDGAEALSHLRRDKFALVISDIEMPRLDGFTLLEQMKRDRRLASTPVILVTSRDKREDRQRGLDLGADAYIVKRKFDHQELLHTIQQVM